MLSGPLVPTLKHRYWGSLPALPLASQQGRRASHGGCPSPAAREASALCSKNTCGAVGHTERPVKPLLQVSDLAWAAGFLKTGFNAPPPLSKVEGK